MEDLNAVGKGCIKGLRANKTEEAIKCSAKTLGTIVPVLDQFDEENNVPDVSVDHKRESAEKDTAIIVNMSSRTVRFLIVGRKHASFPRPKNALLKN